MNTIQRVLIVDDDYNNLHFLGQLLKKNNCQIALADNAKKGFEILETNDIDMVLLDVMMPDMDGFEFCRILKRNPKYDNLPVLYITALTEVEEMERGFYFGASDYITKPFNIKILLSRIKTHLNLRLKTKQLENLNANLEKMVEERTCQLNKANEELRQLDQAKTEFLNIISHEIRTPLNGIMGATYMISKDCANNKVAGIIDIMIGSVERLELFALNALLYTNLRAGKYIFEPELLDIWDIVDESLHQIDESLKAKNLNVIKKRNGHPFIYGNRDLLVKCMTSIFTNSIRYSDEGNAINIFSERNNNNLSLTIRDNGTGFSEHYLKRLFDLFTSSEKFIDQHEGLELAISKLIIEAHNGQISAGNYDKGSFITMEFDQYKDSC